MSRAVPEWVARGRDDWIPPRVKLRVFLRANGECAHCTRTIPTGERWNCDHIVALINGGTNAESNLQVLCEWCHKNKTRADVAEKARTYKRRLTHAGIKKKRPGFRGWRRFNGELVYADSKQGG